MKPPVEWMAEVLRAHNTVCEVSRGHAFFNEVADALIELSSKLDAAETCCSRMYQVLGSLTDDFDIFAHPLVQAAMTALEQRTAPDDLLPWPSKHPDQWRLEARKAEEEAK